jgi:aspartate/methionine/tyrosine aminotransferase
MAGARVTRWEGVPGASWRWDLDRLESLMRPETRLLVVNTPHNPTGHQFGLEAMEHLVALCEARGVQLFVDEAYRGTERRTEDRLPSVTELSESAAALGLLSKGYGLPGLRIGWLASRNRGLLEAAGRVKDFTTICAPAPAEFLGALALRHHRTLLARTRSLLRENLGVLADFMGRHRDRFDWHAPDAGSVCFPLLKTGDAEAFCRAAREEAGVLLAPGRLFDAHTEAVRIGFGRAAFPEDLGALEAWMQSGERGGPADS